MSEERGGAKGIADQGGLEVPLPDRWLSHVSDADYRHLVLPLPDAASVARPWVELALLHPSYLGPTTSRDLDASRAVALGRALELVGFATVVLVSAQIAVIDLGCSTAADADRAARFARQSDPAAAIADRFGLREHSAFGGPAAMQLSNPDANTRWKRTVGMSFLGACGLESMRNAQSLVRESLDVATIGAGATETPKTILQTASQGEFHEKPRYALIEASGPDHDRTFTVSVTVAGHVAEGSASSVRRAEEEAARHLLAIWRPLKRPRGGLSPTAPMSSTVAFADLPSDFRIRIEAFSEQLGLRTSAPRLARALLHSSYLHERGWRMDADNSTLAYLGSAVMDVWAARLQLAAIVAAGDIETLTHPMTVNPWDAASSEAAARELGLDRLLLTGRAHLDHPNEKMLAQAFQALIGALFVEVGEPQTVGQIVSPALSLLKARVEAGWRREKTRLKERTEYTGLEVEYSHEEEGPGHERRFRADVTLRSPTLGKALRLKAQAWHRSKGDADEAAAANVLRTLRPDGIPLTGTGSMPSAQVQRFVTLHECSAIPSTRQQMIMWYRHGALGTGLLSANRLEEFLTWARLLKEVDDATEAALDRFYRACGEWAMSDNRSSVTAAANRLVEWIQHLGGKGDDTALASAEFAELLDLATRTRLLSESSGLISLRDEVEGFALLRRGQVPTVALNPDLRVFGASGSVTLALNRLIARAWSSSSPMGLAVFAGTTANQATIRITADEAPNTVDTFAQDDSLFAYLSSMIGLREVTTTAEGVEVTLTTVSDPDLLGARYVQAFRSPISSADPELLEFARLIHDLKNEVIAYAASLQQRLTSPPGSAAIALEHEASRHLDAARALTSSISARVTDFAPPELDEVDFVSFLRDYLAQKLLSLPPTIRLITPAAAVRSLPMMLPLDYLRSILDNLLKNAVEAMFEEGTLSLEWTFLDQERTVLLDILDTGPGLTSDQVAAFHSGRPLSSTKAGGSGLGLTTVRSLVHRMGGDIFVASGQGGGSTWTIAIPDSARLRL